MCVSDLPSIPLELPKFLKHLVRTIAHTDELPNINIRLVSPFCIGFRDEVKALLEEPSQVSRW